MGGMPGLPCKREVLEYFSSIGYWAVYPRYRGTWESRGRFLEHAPHEDVFLILDELSRPFFVDVFSGEPILWNIKDVVLVGVSFGATATLLAAADKRVSRAVAVAPVVDWTKQEYTAEPLGELGEYLMNTHEQVYRFYADDWEKLKSGAFFSPVRSFSECVRKKTLVLYAWDDPIIHVESVNAYCQTHEVKQKAYKRGGHFGSKNVVTSYVSRRIVKWISASL